MGITSYTTPGGKAATAARSKPPPPPISTADAAVLSALHADAAAVHIGSDTPPTTPSHSPARTSHPAPAQPATPTATSSPSPSHNRLSPAFSSSDSIVDDTEALIPLADDADMPATEDVMADEGAGAWQKQKRRRNKSQTQQNAAKLNEPNTGKEEVESDTSPRAKRAAVQPLSTSRTTPVTALEAPLLAAVVLAEARRVEAPSHPGPLPRPLPGAAPQQQPSVQPLAQPAASAGPVAGQQRGQQQQLQQQQQQQQQQNSNSRVKLPKAFPASAAQIRLCGASAESATSIVLALTPLSDQQSGDVQRWNAKPRLSDRDNRSQLAVATLLDSLRIRPPVTPVLFNRLSTVNELVLALHQIAEEPETPADTREALTNGCSALTEADATTDRQYVPAALHQLATIIRQMKVAELTPAKWEHLLTPRSGCMSRSSDRQQSAASQSRRLAPTRCILRLDFASPLSCLLAQHSLSHCAVPAASEDAAQQQPQPPNSQPSTPKARIEVQPYMRRLTVTEVSGFTIGPLSPGAHPACTAFDEPHGNWQLLREWLKRKAPNCAPSTTYRRLSSGVAAIRFVLEETHRNELYALIGMVDSDAGISRPLKLHLEVPRHSTDTACSICGKAGHSARNCTNKPADGAKTCRRCYTLGHTAANCTRAAEQLVCGICSQVGHPTSSCKRYGPQWTKVAVRQPVTSRNTQSYAMAVIATMRGQPVQPCTIPAQQRHAALPSHLNASSSGQAAWTSKWPAQTEQQPLQPQQPQYAALEQQLARLTASMESMYTLIQAQQQQIAVQSKEMAEQREWMRQMMEQLVKPAATRPPFTAQPISVAAPVVQANISHSSHSNHNTLTVGTHGGTLVMGAATPPPRVEARTDLPATASATTQQQTQQQEEGKSSKKQKQQPTHHSAIPLATAGQSDE